jgi:hypothetical protein
MTLCAAGILVIIGWLSSDLKGTSGFPPLPCPWLPVSFREVAWCHLKASFGLGLLLLPLAIGYGVLAAECFGEPPSAGVVWALKGIYIVWAAVPLALAMQFSVFTDDTAPLLKSKLAYLLVRVVLILFAALASLFASRRGESEVVAAVLLPLTTGGLLFWYVRLLERGKLDWVRW